MHGAVRCPFTNTSSNAVSYAWEFGDGRVSAEDQPAAIRYETPGQYRIKLTAQNNQGTAADTTQVLVILQDDSPFADFTYSGSIGGLPRTVTFVNKAKNSDSYVWQFPGGNPSSSTSTNPTVTYITYNTYRVTLTAKKNDGRFHEQVKTVNVRRVIIN